MFQSFGPDICPRIFARLLPLDPRRLLVFQDNFLTSQRPRILLVLGILLIEATSCRRISRDRSSASANRMEGGASETLSLALRAYAHIKRTRAIGTRVAWRIRAYTSERAQCISILSRPRGRLHLLEPLLFLATDTATATEIANVVSSLH